MKTKKQINLAITAAYLTEIILVGLILAPIYTNISSDVLYKDSYLSEILYYLQKLIMYSVYPVVFSLIIYSIYRFSLSGNKPAFILPISFIFIKNLINFIFDWIGRSYDNTMLISVTVYIFIDLVQISAVALIGEGLITPKVKEAKIRQKASNALGIEEKTVDTLPFRTLLNPKNPVLLTAFIGSAVMTGFTVFSRIRFDMLNPIYGTEDIVTMILYYALDIASLFITYLIITFLLITYLPKEEKEA